jgi:serine phosphatase RsbU (regulator of sigma subunit)/pSer/pThr/pTyr-binding forkhead associated (FHA) protein
VASGDGPGEWFALRGERVVVGRARDCDLILPDVLLSRRHAELVRARTGWVVRDLGSLNGTRLNGARIEREAPLADGDSIGIADWALVFKDAELPSDPGAGDARLKDVTELATRSYVETDQVARQSRILSVLTRAAAAVVATPTAGELLDTLLGHVLEAVPAARGAVALFEGEPLAVVVTAARATSGEAPWSIDAAVAERALRAFGAFTAPRVESGDGSVRAVLCAPLWFGGAGPAQERSAGCVVLEGAIGSTPFDEEHVKLVTAVANLAASRLESLKLREANADKRRLDEDLRGAARIQHSLLPEEVPSVQGFELAANSRLCSAVGADYYDFVEDGGRLLLALGDVAGKGLAASLLMASLRAAVRALWREPLAVSEIVAAINANLRHAVPPNRFGTLVLGRLELDSGWLSWANAGHEAALLVDPHGGHALLEATGTVLGVFEEAVWREERVLLPPGGVLVLLSDGVVEAARAGGHDLGPERLAGVVRAAGRGAGAAAMLAALQGAVDAELGGGRPADDHTFVVVRRDPA